MALPLTENQKKSLWIYLLHRWKWICSVQFLTALKLWSWSYGPYILGRNPGKTKEWIWNELLHLRIKVLNVSATNMEVLHVRLNDILVWKELNIGIIPQRIIVKLFLRFIVILRLHVQTWLLHNICNINEAYDFFNCVKRNGETNYKSNFRKDDRSAQPNKN